MRLFSVRLAWLHKRKNKMPGMSKSHERGNSPMTRRLPRCMPCAPSRLPPGTPLHPRRRGTGDNPERGEPAHPYPGGALRLSSVRAPWPPVAADRAGTPAAARAARRLRCAGTGLHRPACGRRHPAPEGAFHPYPALAATAPEPLPPPEPGYRGAAHQCLDGCGLGGLPARAFRLRGVAGQRPVQPGMGNGSAVRRMAGAGLRSRRGRGALDPPTPA